MQAMESIVARGCGVSS